MRFLKRAGWVALAVAVCLVAWVGVAALVYSPKYVGRVLTSLESSYEDYLYTFPLSPLEPAREPFVFAQAPDDERVRELFEGALEVEDFDSFLAESATQAFIVVKDDRVVYEHYFNGFERDSMLTSFSVAKSFVSTLVGIAIDEGHIGSVDDSITMYLPELIERDQRFESITVRDLLLMAAGLEYKELRWLLFNGDDPLTTYYPDQREISLENTKIIEPPGQYFNYNKYHPQLLGMILERTTGMSVTEYTQTRLWDPLGMEFDGAWALDSVESGFEKMEAGLNASAIDFAKLGRLFLDRGSWDGVQVVSEAWVAESTALDPAIHNAEYYSKSFGPYVFDDGNGYYGYMWYGLEREAQPADIAAEGDRGQIVYLSPTHDVIIVRNGLDFGVSLGTWTDAFYQVSEDL